ncbi:MAG: hypothetical protein AAFU73_19845 [Planctomycetota bacterium]
MHLNHMQKRHQRVALRAIGALTLLALVSVSTGCRALRARGMENRLDRLENRVTALEAQAQATAGRN